MGTPNTFILSPFWRPIAQRNHDKQAIGGGGGRKRKVFGVLLSVLFFTVFTSAQILSTHANSISLPFEHDGVEGVQHLPDIPVAQKAVETALSAANNDPKRYTTPTLFGFQKIMTITGNFFNYVTGPLALFLLFMAGYNLITAELTASEEITKQKMNVIYIICGLVILGITGDLVMNYIYRDSGTFLFDESSKNGLLSEAKIGILASTTMQYLMGKINLFLSFSGAAAILWLVISGLQLAINPGNEDDIEKSKKMIGYTAIGIIIVGLADTIINKALFPHGGYGGVNFRAFDVQLAGLSNYILGFVGIAIFATFVISGVLLVVNQSEDDKISQIKSTMKNVIIGVLVIFSAYTIVATLIRTLLAG